MKILVVGSSNMDISVTVDTLPKKGETLLGTGISYSYGGKGANQACACAKLGADVTFLSCLGDDDYGRQIVSYLKSVGVKTDKIKYSKENPTGTAIISVDKKGNNSIVVVQGANLECDVEYLRQNKDAIKECDYILLQMEIPLSAIEYLIKKGKKYNKTIILNPAPANYDLDRDVYEFIDYITPNETELEVMAFGSKGFKELEESIEKLQNLGTKNILVTLGEEGASLYSNKTNITVPAYKVDAIDTVAAGDCFNGAFVTALSKGESEEEAIRFANMASAIAVTRRGAQTSIPTLKEVEDFKNQI